MSRKPTRQKPRHDYNGILFIGDPHLQNNNPDFRRDEYLEAVLKKLQWCIDYAREENLLPAFLGDMFEHARNNTNSVIVRLMKMLEGTGAIGIYGNHDCRGNQLEESDSLSILITSGCYQLVSVAEPWAGKINGRRVIVAGLSNKATIDHELSIEPRNYFGAAETLFDPDPLIILMTHDDIEMGGYESGKFKPFQIRNVELVINGHIHRPLEPVTTGSTMWMNPGNISRRKRSDASRKHIPRVTRVDVTETSWAPTSVVVPHEHFDDVFYPYVEDPEFMESTGSTFATGLTELETYKTDTGAGLEQFIHANADQFEKSVTDELLSLAAAVTAAEESNTA